MWLNDKEEAIFKPFYDFIYANEDRKYKFVYKNGVEIIVTLHLYEFESDNGLDVGDKDFEEYWEMAFEIGEIINDDSNKLRIGDFILVNYKTVPDYYEAI